MSLYDLLVGGIYLMVGAIACSGLWWIAMRVTRGEYHTFSDSECGCRGEHTC